ncbi:MAG TPA: flavodoxin family protein [Desulfitobacteriaceae bacterium]|nr:flavodoxin family protein [Desulfitobacteriaceae bacterium]
MKKVTAFIGTTSKQATYHAVQEFEKYLKSYGEIDFEYIFLNEYNLEFCQGCKLCFVKGEEFCPLKDDRDVLLEKMENSDGVIFATPSYAFQVSGRLKNLLDRFAYIYHRPKFFGKTFTAIITQGNPFGGKDVRKYLEGSGKNFGFYVTKGTCLWTLVPIPEQRQKKISQKIEKAAQRFYKELNRSTLPQPSLFRLMLFRMTRTSIKSLDDRYRDYNYYKEKGWFESDYYYDINLGPIKKLAGYLFDYLGRLIAKRM